MRELNTTGFMHNRVRMIVAMFLTKDLHIHWREGESYFMRKLVDGDIPANNGGWQWCAGTGADAAPYFRIQNPWTQTKACDPQGDYRRSKSRIPGSGRRLRSCWPIGITEPENSKDCSLLFKGGLAGQGLTRDDAAGRESYRNERTYSVSRDGDHTYFDRDRYCLL
jgi:FAD binding domain of DNA photolyase